MEIGRSRFLTTDRKRKRKSRPIFSIDDAQRLKHVHVIGKTGMGKSTALENWIVQDIRAGNGIAIFDPHGSLAEKVLQLIPPKRYDDVILFDASDREFPIGFNILDGIPESRKPFIANSVVDSFKAAWDYLDMTTPVMDMFLYTTAAALLDFPDGTLLGIKYMLTSNSYRTRVLSHIKDPALRDFWNSDYATMSAKDKKDKAASTLNKIITLITDPTVRNVIGQPRTKFDFKDIMDNKKIFIACLPHGEIGMEKTKLVGSLLLSALHAAALGRTSTATPFFVYVDEFHNFGSVFREMFSGIRKFGVSLTVAHQYVEQLPAELQSAIHGTAGTSIAFQIGVNDAEKLHKSFRATIDDMTGLLPFNALVSLNGRHYQLLMDPPPAHTYPQSPAEIRKRCRAQLAMRREYVDDHIARFIENTNPDKADKRGG